MIRFVPLTGELLTMAILLAMDVPGAYDGLLLGGEAEAMLDGGEFVGAGGVTQHWPGRAEAWLMLRPDLTRKQKVRALRRCQEKLAALQSDPAYRRIEMYVRAASGWNLSFAKTMGFEIEGYLNRWGIRGEDYCLFARVAEA